METGIIWVTTFSPKKEDYHEQSSITGGSSKEARLKRIIASLEEIKDTLVDVIDAYEAEDESSDKLDLLTEALDALEDANDALNDASDEA